VGVLERADAAEETERGRGAGGELATTEIGLIPSNANDGSVLVGGFEAEFAGEAAEKRGAERGDESGGERRNDIRRRL
jgi:hypothetical protein